MNLEKIERPLKVRTVKGVKDKQAAMLGDMMIRLPGVHERTIPQPVLLENGFLGVPMVLSLRCEEFSSLCPMVGQPDYANLLISYVPDKHILEQKYIRDLFTSFREADMFQEEISMTIAWVFCKVLKPKWIAVEFKWTARGGIESQVNFEQGERPGS